MRTDPVRTVADWIQLRWALLERTMPCAAPQCAALGDDSDGKEAYRFQNRSPTARERCMQISACSNRQNDFGTATRYQPEQLFGGRW
jgi:hypothetical protein